MSTDDRDTDDRSFQALVGSLDPAMYVVTVASRGERSGCLVGFATQASIDPPRFLVCLSKANHTFGVAATATLLGVHALRDDDHGLAQRFGHETGDEVDKFEGLDVVDGPAGTPLLRGANPFVGRVIDRFDCGDHVATLLEPVGGSVTREDERPLGLHDVDDVEPGHPA